MKNQQLTVTAFDWVPAFAQGHVRDLRVRWALEEAGLPYDVEVLTQGDQKQPAHLSRQPFGQIPTLQVGGQDLFESGAILWRIAEASKSLLPAEVSARDRVLTWVFAALNTLEPPIGMLATLDLFIKDREAAARIRPEVVGSVEGMLDKLATALGEGEHIAGNFSVADILLTTVLRDVPDELIAGFPTLRAYIDRHTARHAFRKSLEGQMRTFAANEAKYEMQG